MRTWGATLSGLALFAACHSSPGAQKRQVSMPPPLPPASPAAAPTEYVPSEELLRSSAHLAPSAKAPDGGVIVGGLRVDARGQLAADLANPALVGGARVPAFQGGGFLFWSGRALYTAKSFVAPLEPVFGLSGSPSRASFGNNIALLHFGNGGRLAFQLQTRKRVSFPVAGLIDTVALADGRAALLADPNQLSTLGAGARAWKEQPQRAANVSELFVAEDSIWMRQSNGQHLRLEQDGSLVELSSVPEAVQKRGRGPEKDPRWPSTVSESPLKRAIRRGVPLDANTILVEAAGRFARVDARSGAITQIGASVLTSGSECELVPVSGDVLAACRNSNGTSVVIAGSAGAPEIEKVFATKAAFFAGADGILLFGGPCTEKPKPPRWAVCVRQGPGLWRELAEQPRADNSDPWLADAGGDGGIAKSPFTVSRWVPTREGGAFGLVSGEQGGILDASRGTFTQFSSDGYKTASGLFTTASGPVIDSLIVDGDGTIVGYGDRESFRLARDGALTRSPFAFDRIASSGSNALGTDRDGRVWQSVDYGRSWVEVARPPGTQPTARVTVQTCSRAGCDLGQWYRLGFRASAPSFEKRPEAPPAPSFARPPAARLVCEKTAPPDTRWASRARNASGALIEEFDLGAKKFPVKNEGEFALLTFNYGAGADSLIRAATIIDPILGDQSAAGFGRAMGQPRTLRLVEPLGDAKLGESRFNWQEIARASIAQGNQNPSPPSTDSRTAVPVLGSKPASSEGLLLSEENGVFLWARAGSPARVLTFGPESEGYDPTAALVRGKDELVVLAQSDDCAARIFSFANGKGPRTLLELPSRPGQQSCPHNLDALAIAADGSLAVVRVPSIDPPSQDDPALLLKPGQKPTVLAPWSTLSPPEACANDAAAVRALLLVNEPWIKLETPGIDASDEAYVLALVRWSPSKLCVEAVEVGGGTITIGEQELPTSVLAKLGAPPSASRRGFAPGAEHFEPLACKLMP